MIDERINFKITLEGETNHGYKEPVSNKFKKLYRFVIIIIKYV